MGYPVNVQRIKFPRSSEGKVSLAGEGIEVKPDELVIGFHLRPHYNDQKAHTFVMTETTRLDGSVMQRPKAHGDRDVKLSTILFRFSGLTSEQVKSLDIDLRKIGTGLFRRPYLSCVSAASCAISRSATIDIQIEKELYLEPFIDSVLKELRTPPYAPQYKKGTVTYSRASVLFLTLRGLRMTKLPTEIVRCQNMIKGAWVQGEQGTQDVISPYNGKKIGEFSIPSAAQIKFAIEAAGVAQKSWGQLPIKERSKVLFNFRNILLRDQDEISNLKSSECGKTFDEAKAGLMKGIEVLEYALSIQNLDMGGKIEVSRGVTCEFRREALGVVANITPFNFPAMVPMWTIPIALALGNAYVWKPSDKTPLTALKIANALKEAGLPDGLFTVLHGGGPTVDAIIDHPHVKAIGFVGSTKIAEIVYKRGTALGKRVLALGGAKNHIVLLPDANPDLSGVGISDSFTGCAGQRCMAASVLLAVGDVTPHVEKIVKRASSLELGKTMGAIITPAQVEFLIGAIGRAEKAGAKIILDGRKAKAPQGFEKGNWLGPTILDCVTEKSEASSQELFGPILSIVHCKDISHAMQIENSIEYGNACSVFTSNGALAERVVREASTGMVGVNVGVPVPREPFSFGGINASKFGSGDITGPHSLDFWSNMKKVTVKWEAQSDSNWMS